MRDSTDIATAISAVNDIVAEQNVALSALKTTLAGKAAGGTDISLGVTGASVGDIVKVKAVDENGVPTEWEAAGWKKIREFTLPDTPSTDTSDISYQMCTTEGYTDKIATATFSTDDDGNAFDVQDILLIANWAIGRSGNYMGMSDQNGGLGYGNIFSNRLDTSLKTYAYLILRINKYRYALRTESTSWMYSAAGIYTQPSDINDLHITTIKIGTFLDTCMASGSSFIVYGR